MTDKTYNGWTNYETWRVNLEVFDGMELEDISKTTNWDAYDLGEYLKDYAEEMIFEGHRYDERRPSNLMEDYARAFLQNVNWREIAQHMINDYIAESAE